MSTCYPLGIYTKHEGAALESWTNYKWMEGEDELNSTDTRSTRSSIRSSANFTPTHEGTGTHQSSNRLCCELGNSLLQQLPKANNLLDHYS
jgi:hypothetical protein